MTAYQVTQRLEAIASELAQVLKDHRRLDEARAALWSRYNALYDEQQCLELHQHIGKPVRMKYPIGQKIDRAIGTLQVVRSTHALVDFGPEYGGEWEVELWALRPADEHDRQRCTLRLVTRPGDGARHGGSRT